MKSPQSLPLDIRSGLTGPHVLATLLVFFGIVFAVNAMLVYEALRTHSGVVAQEPYRKGLNYNDRIAADDLQSALGWKANLTLDGTGQVGLVMLDGRGQPVGGLAIAGTIGRPATERLDSKLSFRETAPGFYAAPNGLADPAGSGGAWLAVVEVRSGAAAASADSPVYRLRSKLWFKP